ncbi:MAG: hypothetical protein IKR85_12020 [Clostridia bacterium]|nr:hypothetical protein [Clostridia bacterium]
MEKLLPVLLGDGYTVKARGEWSDEDEYISNNASKPYRYIYVSDYDGRITYYDAMVTGERGGEYVPPAMNMTLGKSLEYCRALLDGIVPADWLLDPDETRNAQLRWAMYVDRPMTDEEFNNYIKNDTRHYISFNHLSDDCLPILDDSILAVVGVNGLDTFEITRHEFITKADEPIKLMPFEEALALCDSTREREATVIYAMPVYSNRVSGNDEFDLSWYIVTNRGNYVVDCVLGKHVCDSYEY